MSNNAYFATESASKRSVDMPMPSLYTEEQLNRVVFMALDMYQRQQEQRMNIDNPIGITGMSEGAYDMSKRIKQRATINGKEQWITGETQQDIFNAYLQHAIKAGIVMPASDMPQIPEKKAPLFGDYLQNFLNVYCTDQEATTIHNRNYMIRRHILPRWGKTPMNDITTDALKMWFNELSNEYKKETLLKIKNHMSPALDSAVEDELIKRNPFKSKRFKISGNAGEHHKAIPPEKMKYVREHIGDLPERQRQMCALLSYTGMRMEEVLGLKWEDIDFEENVIHIRRTTVHPKRNQAIVKDTMKTDSSRRDIPIQDKVLEEIQPLQTSGFIVGGEQPLSYQQAKKAFEKLRKTLGIDGYTAHDFRDTCATEWREAGMPLDTISKMLGHANTKVTEKCYVKFRKKGIEEARQFMQAM